MIDNTGLLNDLISTGKIMIKADKLESLAKLAKPFRDLPRIGRIRGMLLGAALGDSFDCSKASLMTGDTQMTLLALSSILEDGGVVPDKIMRLFAGTEIVGACKTVRDALHRYQNNSQWDTCGAQSAEDGVLTRITPYILPHLVIGGMPLVADILIGTMITNKESTAYASSIGFALMLRELLYFKVLPPDAWWRERFVQIASLVDTNEKCISRVWSSIENTDSISALMERLLSEKSIEARATLEACKFWQSGAKLLGAV